MRPPDNIRATARRLGIEPDEDQWERLQKYVDLLLETNKDINLVSRKDEANIWSGHILHSLALLVVLSFPSGTRILDLGSGGGLPGIPIAVLRPDLSITLLDSIQKKMRAVQTIIVQLGISNVDVKIGRAEEMKVNKGSGYDVVVARAVAPLADLLKWSKDLFERGERKTIRVAVGGKVEEIKTPILAAMKGGELGEEIRHATVRFPGIAPILARFPTAPEEMSLLDDKRVIVVPR